MFGMSQNPVKKMRLVVICVLLSCLFIAPVEGFGGDKKKDKDKKPGDEKTRSALILENLEYSKIVWPNPPAIARVKYLNFYLGEKLQTQAQQQKKASWMDRVSGIAAGDTKGEKPRYQLVLPYGVTADSKGRIYVADSKVRAIFIFSPENGAVELLKTGSQTNFKWLTGLATDDSDRLFVSDSGMRRVLVFDAQHKLEGGITEGLASPGGMAIDNENRLLYIADAELDQVLVYDADPPYKFIRKIGTSGTGHKLTNPGDFSRPTNVAVDQDGNLYVADTWNDRVEVFDADGTFIRTFGKAGDGPGYFARPKGIAIDADGHVWVADSVQDRLQAFTPEGRLLIYIGGHGMLPGQFQSIAGVAIDKNNRIITSEQFPGRVQVFRYVTEDEAKAEKERAPKKAPDKESASAKK